MTMHRCLAQVAIGSAITLAAASAAAESDHRVFVGGGVSPLSYVDFGFDGYFRYKDDNFATAEVTYAYRVRRHLEIGGGYDYASLMNADVHLHRLVSPRSREVSSRASDEGSCGDFASEALGAARSAHAASMANLGRGCWLAHRRRSLMARLARKRRAKRRSRPTMTPCRPPSPPMTCCPSC